MASRMKKVSSSFDQESAANTLRFLFLLLVQLVALAGAAPTATAPAGYGPEVLPGPFPETLSGVQFSIQSAEVTINGTNVSNPSLRICGQGPSPWTASNFQQGVIAARLSASSNSSLVLLESNSTGSNASVAIAGQTGWSPSMDSGVLLATVTSNGQNWTSNGSYPIVGTSMNSSASGYDMGSGLFAQGGLDIVSSKAGQSGQRCNSNIGAVWFPFSEGWMSASIAAPANSSVPAAYASPVSYSDNLPADASQIFTWTPTGGRLLLPGVQASSSGLLFAISMANPGQSNGVVSVAPEGGSWAVQIRSDVSLASGRFAPPASRTFSFVYLPFGYTENLIGGHVDAASGTNVFGQGASTVYKVDVGLYQIRVMKPRNRNVSCSDGVLLLQTVGLGLVGNTSAAFLSYAFQGDGSMLVEARTVAVAANGSLTYPLTDTDFYFAWVDFMQPIHPAGYGAPSIISQQMSSPLATSPAAVPVAAGPRPSSALAPSAGSPSPGPSTPPEGAQPVTTSIAPAPSLANGPSLPSTTNRTTAVLTPAQAATALTNAAPTSGFAGGSKIGIALGLCAVAAVLGGVILVVVRRRRIQYPKISLDLKRMNSLDARRIKGVPLAELVSGGRTTSARDFNILQV